MSTMQRPVRITGSRWWPRRWFIVDALVTGVNALAYVAMGRVVAGLLGGDADQIRIIGAGLLAFALAVASFATGTGGRRAALVVVSVNAGWVLASMLVAASGWLGVNLAGTVWIVAQACVVGVLTILQCRSLGEVR